MSGDFIKIAADTIIPRKTLIESTFITVDQSERRMKYFTAFGPIGVSGFEMTTDELLRLLNANTPGGFIKLAADTIMSRHVLSMATYINVDQEHSQLKLHIDGKNFTIDNFAMSGDTLMVLLVTGICPKHGLGSHAELSER